MSVLKYSYHFSIVVDICWMSNALLLMLSSFFTVQKASDTCSLQIKLNSHFHILRLSKGNLIFCCAVPTDHNFWKTKIIIILISSKNISFFLLFLFLVIWFFFFSITIKYIKNKDLVHLKSSCLHLIHSNLTKLRNWIISNIKSLYKNVSCFRPYHLF